MLLKMLEYWAGILERVTYPAQWTINSSSPGISLTDEPETGTPATGKSIERYGQQKDGSWVLKEYRDVPNSYREKRVKYYTPQGERISPEESPWQGDEKLSVFGRFSSQVRQPVFCPMQPHEDPNALSELVRAAWNCRGGNFMPTLFTMGWVVGSLQVWHKQQETGDKSFPILNIFGEGSRVAYDMSLSLIGSDWESLAGSIGRLNYRNLRKLAKYADLLGSLVVSIDQPRTYRNIQPEKFQEIIKGWYDREAVSIREECININSSLLILSRSPYCDYGEKANLDRHILLCPFNSEPSDSTIVSGHLFTQASASFFRLIALGWQGDRIAEFERVLCDRLNATPDTLLNMGKLSDLAIVGHYARVLQEMAQVEESVLEWLVRENRPQICDGQPLPVGQI
ncbi:hypothetical protein IQ235_14280 [Oscillatoriales cyanobacterium LEGE 11467]|uniref:Uncharacterized protein n=1 Tax=Zarconia navalis LEGE 11467 TaxID=1828826 RepID=A0A928Z802_9CYAN|nr:hypothetical protein [Zarconia navalis]MBE9041947.1 hypothetical protein [Zarconia navalis LEGE 11467]